MLQVGLSTSVPEPADLNKWAFQYRYDGRRRMVEKRVPNNYDDGNAATNHDGWVYMVYDNRDRLVLTQDAEQRKNNQWLFTKYDVLNRPVSTGFYSDISDRLAMQSIVNDFYDPNLNPDMAWGESYSGGINDYGYTDKSFPEVSIDDNYLTVTYYDNYDFRDELNLGAYFGSAYNFDQAEISDWVTKEVTENTRILGQVTGSLTRYKESGTNKMISTITYYDDRYRVIQTKSSNILEGIDVVSNLVDFVGKVEKTITNHNNGTESTKITRNFDYDHVGRLNYVTHKIDTETEVTLLQNSYNELGQLIEKDLHSGEQKVDYGYNIRGWLTNINDSQLSDPTDNDLFGMELYYNTSNSKGNTAMFNGNISSMEWNSADGTTSDYYNYSYGPMNRLKEADFGGSLVSKFDVSNLNYDLNGNIRDLTRNNELAGIAMDNLEYRYDGNQLQAVTDTGDEEIGFNEPNSHDINTLDYTYDANGNLTSDLNKGIATIEYNHLNLPVKVTKDANNYIEYIYDAAGIKLAQVVHQESSDVPAVPLPVKTTYYMGEFIYEKLDANPMELQLINHEEGRVVKDELSNWEYQYHLKDHLGNVRVTFTSKNETETISTDFESATNAEFENYSRINFDLMDHTDAGTVYTGAQMINGGTLNQIGVAKSLAVMPGDKVSAEIFGRYFGPESKGTDLTQLALGIVGAFSGVTYFGTEGTTSVDGFYNGGVVICPTCPYRWEDDLAPKVYLNILVFDKNYEFQTFVFDQIDYGYEQADGSIVKGPHNRMFKEVVIKEEGYVYIYVSNENPTIVDAWFDDFTVTHEKTPIIQKDDYYPFGLSFNSWQRGGNKKNDYLYNGKEMQDELDIGWMDYGARMYDGSIGRWHVVDPLSESYLNFSPYNYVMNSPNVFVDPDGMRANYIYEDGEYYKVKKNGDKKKVSWQRALGSVKGKDKVTLYQYQDPSQASSAEGQLRIALTNAANFQGAMDFNMNHIYREPDNYGFDLQAIEDAKNPSLSNYGVQRSTDVSKIKSSAFFMFKNMRIAKIVYGETWIETLNTKNKIRSVSWKDNAYSMSNNPLSVDRTGYHIAFWDSRDNLVARITFSNRDAKRSYIENYYDNPRVSKYNNLFENWFWKNNPPSNRDVEKYNEYNKSKTTFNLSR